MANIPVERTGGGGWWKWLLALLLLALLIWLIAELLDDEPDADDVAVVDDIEAVEPPEDPDLELMELDVDGAITSLAGLANADLAVGRAVNLDGVNVSSLAGDSTFFISQPGTDRRALIVLEDLREWRLGPGDGSDGEYDVNEGNTIDLDGEVVRYQEGAAGTSDLSGADRERVLRDEVYIRAEDLVKQGS